MQIAGIDPSLTSTGVAVARDLSLIDTYRIRTSAPKQESVFSRARRLEEITNQVLSLVAGCEVVGIESPAFGVGAMGKQHDRSGIWWRLVFEMIDRGQQVIEVPPKVRAMYATGNGGADKKFVMAAAKIMYPHADITGDDVADAVVIAGLVGRATGHIIEPRTPMPKQLSAVKSLTI